MPIQILEKDELINKKYIELSNVLEKLQKRYEITNDLYYDELNKVEKLEKENKELIEINCNLNLDIDDLNDKINNYRIKENKDNLISMLEIEKLEYKIKELEDENKKLVSTIIEFEEENKELKEENNDLKCKILAVLRERKDK